MRVRVLGGFELTSPSGAAVQLPTRKTRLVLAVLALAGGKGVSRAQLCSLFWPDRAAPQACSSLRQALTVIRRSIGGDASRAGGSEGDLEIVRLGLADTAIDALAFELHARQPDRNAWVIAAHLYQGDLLEGVELPDNVDEWLAANRRACRRSALELVERMSKVSNDAIEVHSAAEALAERLLATDATAEEAHRALIRIHQHRGRANAALRQFELCRTALKKELAAEPDTETMALAASLRVPSQGEVPAEPIKPRLGALAHKSPPVSGRDRDQPSVIVMPFDNLSGPGDDYFADGVVEEITAALSRVREFFVIARQSAFTYKGRFVDVCEIGRELGVNYAVEGTVRRGGDRLRISVQLVDAETRRQLWSERYEGATRDIFEFQDQIAAQVAGAINPAVRHAEIEWAKRKPPASLRAYDLLMRAYPKLWGQNAKAVEEAVTTIEQAIELDPAYGRAHALLAWCHALNITYLWSSNSDLEAKACMDGVERALPTIGDDPTALTACGATLSLLGDQGKGSAFLSSALSLDPNNAWAWSRFGWVGIYQDQAQNARERFERAMALSPLDPFTFNMRMGLGASLALEGRFQEAVAIARDVVTKNPNVTWAYRQLAAWAAINEDLTTARWAAQKLLAAQPDYTIAKYLTVPSIGSVPHFRDAMAAGMRLAGIPEK